MKNVLRTVTLAAGLLGVTSAVSATARADWFECQPTEVYEFNDSFPRVHVKCANSITLNGNTVRFIALAISDVVKANRFVTDATSALLSRKIFVANIPASTATNVSGCGTDCRTPTVWGVKN